VNLPVHLPNVYGSEHSGAYLLYMQCFDNLSKSLLRLDGLLVIIAVFVMSLNKIEITEAVEKLEDPNDKAMVFYRIKLSAKPSRDFIAEVYNFWKNHALNRELSHRELLSDYEGNLLVHTYLKEDVSDVLALLQNAVVSVSRRNA
jgi:hypothetical protein